MIFLRRGCTTKKCLQHRVMFFSFATYYLFQKAGGHLVQAGGGDKQGANRRAAHPTPKSAPVTCELSATCESYGHLIWWKVNTISHRSDH